MTNTLYTLLVEVGNRKDFPATAVVELVVGNTAFTATPQSIPEGAWRTFSVTYTSLPADVGKSLTIRLSADSAQGNFDNVRLDATPLSSSGDVPEPASLALAAVGLASLGFLRRRAGGNSQPGFSR